MNIKQGGFIPTTLLDYPEEIASVIFLPGCNLKCPYCHNPDIVNPKQNTLDPIEDIIEAIDRRKHLISGVVISGGEPTLYNDLGNYIELLHSYGLKVKLDTNGTKPELLKELKPDYIAMDLKTSLEKYPSLGYKNSNCIKESIEWLKGSNIPFEIRTTAAPIIFTEHDLKLMIPLLKGVERYYITNFRNGRTLIPSYNNNAPYSEIELKKFVKICQDSGINCILR